MQQRMTSEFRCFQFIEKLEFIRLEFCKSTFGSLNECNNFQESLSLKCVDFIVFKSRRIFSVSPYYDYFSLEFILWVNSAERYILQMNISQDRTQEYFTTWSVILFLFIKPCETIFTATNGIPAA